MGKRSGLFKAIGGHLRQDEPAYAGSDVCHPVQEQPEASLRPTEGIPLPALPDQVLTS